MRELLISRDDTHEIVAVNIDTGATTRSLGIMGYTPSWTLDQRNIVFGSGNAVLTGDESGRNIRVLAGGFPGPVNRPQLAANGWITVISQGMVFAVRADGSGLRPIVTGGVAEAPSLHPTGLWLTYTFVRPGDPGGKQIWACAIDGSDAWQLTYPWDLNNPNGNASALPPRDTGKVAIFWGKEDENVPIWQWGRRDLAMLSFGPYQWPPQVVVPCVPAVEGQTYPKGPLVACDNPAFSPDGQQLIFDGGSPYQEVRGTYMCNLDGSGVHRVAPMYRGGGNVPLRYV